MIYASARHLSPQVMAIYSKEQAHKITNTHLLVYTQTRDRVPNTVQHCFKKQINVQEMVNKSTQYSEHFLCQELGL